MTITTTPATTSSFVDAARAVLHTDPPGPCPVNDDARDAADDMWAALDRVIEHSAGSQIAAIKAVRQSSTYVPLLAARDLVRARWSHVARRKLERIDIDQLTDTQIARILAITTEAA